MGEWRGAEEGESRKEKQSERNSQVNIGGKGDREKEMSKRDTEMKGKKKAHLLGKQRGGGKIQLSPDCSHSPLSGEDLDL